MYTFTYTYAHTNTVVYCTMIQYDVLYLMYNSAAKYKLWSSLNDIYITITECLVILSLGYGQISTFYNEFENLNLNVCRRKMCGVRV